MREKCSVPQIQLAKKPLNLLSTQPAGFQLLSHRYSGASSLQGPSPAQPSRWYHSEDFLLMEFCLKERHGTQKTEVFITPEFPENTSLILGMLLINNRRKSFQVLYTVQKMKNELKCRADLNAT